MRGFRRLAADNTRPDVRGVLSRTQGRCRPSLRQITAIICRGRAVAAAAERRRLWCGEAVAAQEGGFSLASELGAELHAQLRPSIQRDGSVSTPQNDL